MSRRSSVRSCLEHSVVITGRIPVTDTTAGSCLSLSCLVTNNPDNFRVELSLSFLVVTMHTGAIYYISPLKKSVGQFYHQIVYKKSIPKCIVTNFSQKPPKNRQTAMVRFLSKTHPKDLRNAYLNCHGPEITIKYLKLDLNFLK